jgi:hypothetical protein
MTVVFHREFAKSDELFKRACQLADTKPTKRQAAKWRRGAGKARQFMRQAAQQLTDEAREQLVSLVVSGDKAE